MIAMLDRITKRPILPMIKNTWLEIRSRKVAEVSEVSMIRLTDGINVHNCIVTTPEAY